MDNTTEETFPLRKLLWPLLLLKVMAGWAVGGVYLWHYQGQGDTFSLFADAQWLAQLAQTEAATYWQFFFFDDWETDQAIFSQLRSDNPRAVVFTKIVSLLSLLTFGNYWAASALLSLLSFAGSWYFLKKLWQVLPQLGKIPLLGFLLWPSALFWTAGLLKEPLLMGCLGLMTGFWLELFFLDFFKCDKKKKRILFFKIGKSFLFVLSFYLVFRMKYYYLGAWLPSVICLAVGVLLYRRQASFLRVLVAQAGIFAAVLLLATQLHPNLQPQRFLDALVKNHQLMAEQTERPENLIVLPDFAPTWEGVLQSVPLALWEGFFRPYVWEGGHWLKKLAGMERLLLFVLMAVTLFRLRQSSIAHEIPPLVFPLLAYVFLLMTLLSLAAPNLGNLVRYQSCVLPFLVMGCLAVWGGDGETS